MGKGIKSVCRSQSENMFQFMAMCVSPKELSLLQAVGVISMMRIKIIRQEIVCQRRGNSCISDRVKVEWRNRKKWEGRGKRRINTKADCKCCREIHYFMFIYIFIYLTLKDVLPTKHCRLQKSQFEAKETSLTIVDQGIQRLSKQY